MLIELLNKVDSGPSELISVADALEMMQKITNVISEHGNLELIQTFAVVFTVLTALTVLWITQKSGKKRETLAIIAEIRNSTSYQNVRQDFQKLINSQPEPNLNELAKKGNSEEDGTLTIEKMLNHYELMSLGIRMGTLDEHFYKLWFRSSMINDFHKLKPFIDDVRTWTTERNYWTQFEKLALRWEKNPQIDQDPSRFTKFTNFIGL